MTCLLDLVREQKPRLLILAKTRTSSSSAIDILRRTAFESFAVSEAIGFAGGLWAFWNSNHLQIEVANINDQMMILLILKDGLVDWNLTRFMPSPNQSFEQLCGSI